MNHEPWTMYANESEVWERILPGKSFTFPFPVTWKSNGWKFKGCKRNRRRGQQDDELELHPKTKRLLKSRDKNEHEVLMSHVMLGLWFPRVNICSVSGSRDEMMQWRRGRSFCLSTKMSCISQVKKRESGKTRSRRTSLPVPFASDATSVFILFSLHTQEKLFPTLFLWQEWLLEARSCPKHVVREAGRNTNKWKKCRQNIDRQTFLPLTNVLLLN